MVARLGIGPDHLQEETAMYFKINTKRDYSVKAFKSQGDAASSALDDLGINLVSWNDPVAKLRQLHNDGYFYNKDWTVGVYNLSQVFEILERADDPAELSRHFRDAVDEYYN